MRAKPPAPRQSFATPLLLALIGLLAGCGASPERERTDQAGDREAVMLPGELPSERPAYSQALPPSEHSALFREVENRLGDYDWLAAEAALDQLPASLNSDDRTYRDYLEARIAWLRGDTARTDALLAGYPADTTAPALATMIRNFQRYTERMSGNYLDSARIGSELLVANADPTAGEALKRSIWRDLERLPASALATGGTQDSQWQAWLELARISADTGEVDTLRSALRAWRERHRGHPAATPLPGGLEALLDQGISADKVALLLPLSGRLAPAAEAVRDGYLAAFYAARATGGETRDLIVLDTHAYENAVAAYRDAVQRGASLVVGPLSKQSVAELGNAPERPVPILALNRSEQPLPPAATALVQMSLAPEDEVEALAQLAYGQGARRALVVRPAGEWGDKMDAALREHWRNLGGEFASIATYASAEGYSDAIQRAFHIEASRQRAREVRSMLATNIEYTARRRQDFDAIFLLSSSPGEARSIKPLLTFHYAGAVPVYAPSSVYSGIPDHRDQDLNGIILMELPWLLGASPDLRVAIAAGDTGSDSYTRLNALGADAYLLQSRFSQLQAGPDALLRGNTGLLSMDPRLRIMREPRPATFDGGELKPL